MLYRCASYLLIFSHCKIFFHVCSFMLLWMETTTSMSSSPAPSAFPLRVKAFLSVETPGYHRARQPTRREATKLRYGNERAR